MDQVFQSNLTNVFQFRFRARLRQRISHKSVRQVYTLLRARLNICVDTILVEVSIDIGTINQSDQICSHSS